MVGDSWVARFLRNGARRRRVETHDGRCVVITINPVTLEHNPTILRMVATARQGCLGLRATVEPGHIALGASVFVEPPA